MPDDPLPVNQVGSSQEVATPAGQPAWLTSIGDALWLTSIGDALLWIKERRDGFLGVFGAISLFVYICGFLVWALFAFSRGLGMFPVLDAQYFLAGALPAVAIAVFLGGARLLVTLYRSLSTDITEKQKEIAWWLQSLGAIFSFVGMCGVFAFPHPYSVGATISIVVGFVCFIANAFFARDNWAFYFQLLFLGCIWLMVVTLLLYVILGYGTDWFPAKWPQAFGGPAPTRVQLDLDTTQLSNATKELFLPEGVSAGAVTVYRSRDLYLIFESNDFLLISTSPAGGPIYKIRRGAVFGIFPADDQPKGP